MKRLVLRRHYHDFYGTPLLIVRSASDDDFSRTDTLAGRIVKEDGSLGYALFFTKEEWRKLPKVKLSEVKE